MLLVMGDQRVGTLSERAPNIWRARADASGRRQETRAGLISSLYFKQIGAGLLSPSADR
jgi:hypothetical protein